MEKREGIRDYLECEKWPVFVLLMMVGGYLGAFTYTLRGGVFCNAQTANFVLFAMALGNRQFGHAVYYLIPMSAYMAGTIVSEALPLKIRKYGLIRWDTALVGMEMLIIFLLGFLPESAPYQITQIAINFICSMQYNTFRQAQGIPVATTFCTNHLRQTGVYLTKWFRKREFGQLKRSLTHAAMLGIFVLGGTVCTALCSLFQGRAIWGASLLTAIAFVDLLYADLKKEKGLLHQKPAGH